ncbi:MAG: hypothetical protein KJP00_01340 [Bacteroidia bacterium]|nr:hypothetical protein [Bacteroidia bacterium]
MIKRLTVVLLLQFVFSLSILCQVIIPQDTLIIPSEYGQVSSPHIIARSGSLIINQSDSLHLISHENFQLIVALAENMKMMDSLFVDLNKLYAKDNRANQQMIDNLNILLEQSISKNKLVLEEGNHQLNQILPNLNRSQLALEVAQDELQMANEQLNQYGKDSRRKGITYAVSGTLVGLVLGLIIAN